MAGIKRIILALFTTLFTVTVCFSNEKRETKNDSIQTISNENAQISQAPQKRRLQIGGYGEIAMTRNFYSDNYLRYSNASQYKDDKSHGRFDIPHVVIWIGYDFGKGWTMGTEIEFEHGGTESAVEIEEEEGGEYEAEIERGGEVALEQFWIQKRFCKALNLRMGHIIVPVGATNMYHLPTEFFGVYRPEGENTIMPCTWHETGISIWGVAGKWRYEVLFIPGLDSDRFSSQNWIGSSAGSPYEFKIANAFAGAFRVDNYTIPGLRIGISGYAGNSFSNTLSPTNSARYENVKGTVYIGAIDFCYNSHNLIVRGNFDYGHLNNSAEITAYNMTLSKNSPSPKQAVGSDAIVGSVEAGYNIFSPFKKISDGNHKLYIFGRYEYYDSMYKTDSKIGKKEWCGRQRVSAGINYFPMKEIVIKGEYSIGILKSEYNNEPSISLGVAYSGLFKM